MVMFSETQPSSQLEALLLQTAAGNREAFASLYHRTSPSVYGLALTYVHSGPDAEDVTQTVFLKYLEKCPPLEAGKEKAWLLQVTVNQCRDLWRLLKRRATGPLEEAGEPAFDTPEQSELFRQVMALPPKYRAAVYLYYYEGCSVQETAAAMGANPSTVQTWLMRARGKLKLILQEAEP